MQVPFWMEAQQLARVKGGIPPQQAVFHQGMKARRPVATASHAALGGANVTTHFMSASAGKSIVRALTATSPVDLQRYRKVEQAPAAMTQRASATTTIPARWAMMEF
jgi:hypothetical protein